MRKFLATVRLIVEAEDWGDAHDCVDELIKPRPEFHVRASTIDSIIWTKFTDFPKVVRRRKKE